MLRTDDDPKGSRVAWAAVFLVGAAAAALVALKNPGNMGICGACFLRDVGGSLGLAGKGPAIFRPEVPGLILGALAWRLVRGRFEARSGSHAVSRFVLGGLMGIGALVFLGCPFRMLQRLGGGDLNALSGAAGLVVGVGAALQFERRGYSVGKTSVVAPAVGLVGPVVALALLAMFLRGGILAGPGPGSPPPPPHAPWVAALGIAAFAGAALSATGFCAISACRQVWSGPRRMLVAAGLLILGYGACSAATGNFKLGFEGQPAAHSEHLWSFLAMVLVGLAGAFAGGCPVRQMVMAGEGNGDAFVTCMGIVAGGAVAHNLGTAASPAGVPPAGHTAVLLGIGLAILYAFFVVRSTKTAA
jgi:YedE family putative selenium metabolism protein